MESNYQQQALAGATGIELVLALYDGAIRFLYRAMDAVEQNDPRERRIAVKRVTDILMYLQARLRFDVGGKPARALSDFYAAMFTMSLEASGIASREGFLEVISCIRNVREAWAVVAKDPEAQRMLPRELRTREERYVPASIKIAADSDGEPGATSWNA
jgi:flagellar protein FliS